jgi:hypothetical protein
MIKDHTADVLHVGLNAFTQPATLFLLIIRFQN